MLIARYSMSATVKNILALLIQLAMLVCVCVLFPRLPETVPAHYNALGEVDRYGSRLEVLILPAVSLLLFLGLGLVLRHPKIWNVPVRITEENSLRVYRFVEHMLVTTRLFTVAMFFCITLFQLLLKNLPFWFTPLYLVLLLGIFLYYSVRLYMSR